MAEESTDKEAIKWKLFLFRVYVLYSLLGLSFNSVNYQRSFLKEKYHLRIENLFEMGDRFQVESSSKFGCLRLNQ